jgi:hypothetical protein
MNAVAAVLLILLPGFVPALALTRNAARAGLMACPVCVVIGGVAGIVCVVLRIPVAPCAIVLFLAANVAGGVRLLRSRRAGTSTLALSTGSDPVALVLFGLTSIVLTVRPPQTIAWDARSIWWFHASWFQAGGEVVVDAVRNPIMIFSHPEYPVGVPSFVGAVWGLFGGEHLEIAMAITSILTAMAVALLAAAVFWRSRVDDASVAVPTLLAAAIVMQGQGLAAAGYLDVLCASLVALAFVGFVRDRGASIASLAALMAGTLTKSEGLYFAVLVSLVAMFWVERRGRFVLAVGAAAAPAVVWMAIVRLLNPDLPTDVAPGGFVRLLLLDSERWTRLWDALPGVWSEMWVFLVAAVVSTAALGVRAGARSSVDLRLAATWLGASVLTSAGLVAVYAAGVPPVQWWLDTSLERASVTPKVMCLITTAVAVNALGGFERDSGVRARTQRELLEASTD